VPAAGRSDLEYLIQPGALRLLRAYGQVRPGALQRSIVVLVERLAGVADTDETHP
jgi:hypothetical protein